MKEEVIGWLLRGDPSMRFQTMRDLMEVHGVQLQNEQKEIETKGWRKKFLSCREESGLWGGGLYSPKWTSTHYTLQTLMQIGFPPGNKFVNKSPIMMLNNGFYKDGGINLFPSYEHSETCVTGMILSLLCYFQIKDDRMLSLIDHVLNQQMDDGGWNCQSYNVATHSSFHTTISVLEAVYEFEKTHFLTQALKKATERAHEFLLKHHLFRSDRTGRIVDVRMTRGSFPPRWRDDFLRALDYFRAIRYCHDPRFCDAIQLLRKKRKNGRWPLQQKYAGRVYFDMEKVGQASRMNTLRALRILKWWDTKSNGNCKN